MHSHLCHLLAVQSVKLAHVDEVFVEQNTTNTAVDEKHYTV